MQPHQKDIFKSVVKANAERLSNMLHHTTESKVISLGRQDIDDDKVRELALQYFQKQTLRFIQEQL
jgi:hypothetical protein